jgi:hypothetical protein
MGRGIIPVSLLQPGVICILKKKRSANSKNNNLRKRWLKTNIPQSTELGYPRVVALLFDGYNSAHA